MSGDFSAEQKRYLEGFVSGLGAMRSSRGLPPLGARGGAMPGMAAAAIPAEPTGPDAAGLKAMLRIEAAGKKLDPVEVARREEHGLDSYGRMKKAAKDGVYPKGPDVLRWRYHGLFFVGPAQDSYMVRLRIPNGVMTHWQFAGVADVAEAHGGPYAHVTTRANLQVREIPATDGIQVLEKLVALGLTCKGSGADNIRNVTGTPTAGIDPQELLDTRPYASEWHHHILNDRSLYGLPRKFNVAFDGAGLIAALEDTNDIGFSAVEVRDGFGVEPGVWFRLALGGITGHKDLARDTGVIVNPENATRVADAIVRVFVDHGDRTDRKKARLKYVLDAWGFDKFLVEVEAKLGGPLVRVPSEAVVERPASDRQAHIGVHRQKQDGLSWIGVTLPVGKMTVEQMRGIAKISRDLGDGDIRLTVWQNLLISGVSDENVALAVAAIETMGLGISATAVRAGLVACTGSEGCKFAAAPTKRNAEEIALHCDATVQVDRPVNIHLTGCHNSCAQHYIGDIGLIGQRVTVSDEGDTVDGYNVCVGGGFGPDAGIGRELFSDVKAEDAPRLVEQMLKRWMANRASDEESFADFTRRHEIDQLTAIFAAEAAE
jgi:ferredoxin-nitrite reductase